MARTAKRKPAARKTTKRKPAKKAPAKKKWMQSAAKRMKAKKTTGSFTAICKRWGFSGVTEECIRRGLKSRSAAIRKKANFARNARKASKKRRRK